MKIISSLDQLIGLQDGDIAQFVAGEWRDSIIALRNLRDVVLTAAPGAIFTGRSRVNVENCTNMSISGFSLAIE